MLQKFKKNLFIILLILTSLTLINGCERLNNSHDKNLNSPTITNSQDLIIIERSKEITTITATDLDPNTTITYSVTPNIFTINTQGDLSFKNQATYQETPYKAHVTAFDGELSSTKTFTITVLKDTDSDGTADIADSNVNSPTITNSQDLIIIERSKAITTITATDLDPNTTITYSVTPNIFTINTHRDLSFKNQATYQETPYKAHVTAFDGELSSTKTFTITVLKDTDSDGTADIADSDDDNDGINDELDALPLDASSSITHDQATLLKELKIFNTTYRTKQVTPTATQKENNKYDITILQKVLFLDQQNNISVNPKINIIYSDMIKIGTCHNGSFTAAVEGKSASCRSDLASTIQSEGVEVDRNTIFLQNISSVDIIDVYESELDNSASVEILNSTIQYKDFNFHLTEVEEEESKSQKKCTSSLAPISATDKPIDSYIYNGRLSHTNNQAMIYNNKPLYLFIYDDEEEEEEEEEEEDTSYLFICEQINN